jgi:hypothetical protein
VVIYRNGVGYFERAGTVRDSEVHFKMKESEVGDFLASFAVLERGGSSVRSASFPIRLADDEPIRPPVATEAERRGLRKVVLGLDGKSHDLQVGYIVAAPLWRPSYRLVLGAGGMAELQAWGVVENLSGEDWKGVKLSLVAGAPIAFESTLGQPVVPSRPMVTDTGEVMLAVPKAEVALASDAVAAPAPSASPASAEMPVEGASAEMNAASSEDDGSDGERPMRRGPGRSAASKSRAKKAEMAADSARTGGRGGPGMGPSSAPMAAAASAMAVPMSSTPRSLASLAAMVSNGSVTRFDMPNPVTVPDRTATMVMLLARSIPGEAIFLFAPDGAVETSSQHPYRVVRFSNRTGGGLEKGPIAVFESDAFLGQGVVEALPDGANTMCLSPWSEALPSIAVRVATKWGHAWRRSNWAN